MFHMKQMFFMENLEFCPVCSFTRFKPFLTCRDFTVSRETFQIVECENCGFCFTNPRPAENEIGRYYQSEEYVSHSGTKKGLVNKVYHLVKSYTLAKKPFFVPEWETYSSDW